MNRQQRRARARHIKKTFGGKAVEEVHAELSFPPHVRCATCSRRPMTRIIIMAPLDEARKRMPELEGAMLLDPDGFMKNIVRIKESRDDIHGKPYFRISVNYFCRSCTPQAERTAAKAPSWCIVEINRGPDPERVITSG